MKNVIVTTFLAILPSPTYNNVLLFCTVRWFSMELQRKYYLVHEHQCPFMTIIDFFIAWFSNTFPFDLFPSLSQIIVPQLIAAKKERTKKGLDKRRVIVHNLKPDLAILALSQCTQMSHLNNKAKISMHVLMWL